MDRHEDVINHNWYKFLLWILVLGGLALMAWLSYGSFLWGWYANPCKPPCVATAAPTSAAKAHKSSPTAPAAKKAASRLTRPAAPQQVQLSGSVDLVHHEAPTQTATPAQRPNLEDQEARFWEWAESRNP